MTTTFLDLFLMAIILVFFVKFFIWLFFEEKETILQILRFRKPSQSILPGFVRMQTNMKHREDGQINLFNGAKILGINRGLPGKFMYGFIEHRRAKILAEGLTIITDQGNFHLYSCSRCSMIEIDWKDEQ